MHLIGLLIYIYIIIFIGWAIIIFILPDAILLWSGDGGGVEWFKFVVEIECFERVA